MSIDAASGESPAPAGEKREGEYVVVARRYRPQSFQDLVGQQQVSQALTNAINTNRVGHAYLFTGARGVGKTSTARILAKALNCVRGPTPTPCNECDLCQSVSVGEDVDVLEIDGASNRGIDEIRQLRSNVNVRPSRARFKIYIIDEVHMLTTQAFNALLKTLEEPPEHVKFIFCTTDPEKIPITVLSRCQRFDFPPVETESILDRLRFIVQTEKVAADDEALQLLARRAGGSMRDSQSLLEQLLSFCGERITVDDVHKMLGTARGGSLSKLASHLVARDAAGALAGLETAIGEGVDVGQLAEQLLGYFRDMMAATVGCPVDMLLHCLPAEFAQLAADGRRLGLETILAIVQILDHAVTRMRQSAHVRTLVEMALVRICKLEDLDELARLVAQVQSGGPVTVVAAPASTQSPAPAPSVQKKTADRMTAAESPVEALTELRGEASGTAFSPANVSSSAQSPPSSSPPASSSVPSSPVGELSATASSLALTVEVARRVWQQALEELEAAGDMTADMARFSSGLATAGPNRLVVSFRAEYTHQKQSCERPERKTKLEQALARVAGHPIRVDFELLAPDARPMEKRPTVTNQRQRRRELENHPLVQQVKQLFEAEVLDVVESRPSE